MRWVGAGYEEAAEVWSEEGGVCEGEGDDVDEDDVLDVDGAAEEGH